MAKNKSFKRRKNVFLLFAASALAVCLLSLAACNKKENAKEHFETCFEIVAEYDSASKTLRAKQDALYCAAGDSDCIIFRLYANAFAKDHNAIKISSVKIDGLNVDYEICGEDKTVMKMDRDMRNGEAYYISIDYELAVPHGEARLGEYDGRVNLAHFYPCPARFENGWRQDAVAKVGDPFLNSISSFYASIEYDGELDIAAPGEVEINLLPDGKRLAEITAECIRDFAVFLGEFDVYTREVALPSHTVKTKYYCFDDVDPTNTLDRVEECLRLFSDAFGDYPYDNYTAVQANIGGAGGMEYGALAAVSPTADRENFLDAVTHETAHQWWFGVVGNDQLNSAWLDEGLAEFCTYYFYYLKGERSKFSDAIKDIAAAYNDFATAAAVGSDQSMARHLDAFISENEYVAVAYMKSALFFDYLHTLTGDAKFRAALKSLQTSNKFKEVDETDLAASFAEQGYRIGPIIKSWL